MKVYPHQYLFEVEVFNHPSICMVVECLRHFITLFTKTLHQDQEWCIGFQDSNLQTKDGKEITLLGGQPQFIVFISSNISTNYIF